MQRKFHIKKDDLVRVISGNQRGKEGKVLELDKNKNRAIVEGLNMVSKHQKPDRAQNADGGIVKKEAPIHISNLMLIDAKGNATRISREKDKDGKSVRKSKKSGEII